MRSRDIFGIALLAGWLCMQAVAVDAADWQGKTSSWNGYQRHDFHVDGRDAYVVVPEDPAPGHLWVWRARFPTYHPEVDLLLLERGFHVAYINTDDMLGSPRALQHWDAFYAFMTQEKGLAEKVALEAVSRGGLFAYRWAARNPDAVACIYADVPVCDFKSWPLGQGSGVGNQKAWRNLLKQYGFTEKQALAYRENPIDVLSPIAKAKIPLLHLISRNDRVVPAEENTDLLAERYREMGGYIEIIEVKEGPKAKGHHFDHPDPKRVADFISKTLLEHQGGDQSAASPSEADSLRANKPATVIPVPSRLKKFMPKLHEEKLAEAQNGKVDFVMIGDSITHAWGRDYPGTFKGNNLLNLGFPGDGTQNVLWRIQDGALDGISPRLVTLLIGTNNLAPAKKGHVPDNPKDIFAGIQAIVKEVRTRLPESKLLVFSIFPRKPGPANDRVKAVNAMLPQLADQTHVFHVDINQTFLTEKGEQNADLYSRKDLVHLVDQGYLAWAKALQPILKEYGFKINLNAPALQAIRKGRAK